MTRSKLAPVVLGILLVAAQPGWAKRGNDLSITDGQGEGIQVRHGFFGHKSAVVKDRLGDGFAVKKGWFGTSESEGAVLGNEFHRKKGLLGGTDISGHDIFGDAVRTKKGIFGRRTTSVDVSGAAGMIKNFLNDHGLTPPASAGLGAPRFGPRSAAPNPSADPLDRDVLQDPN